MYNLVYILRFLFLRQGCVDNLFCPFYFYASCRSATGQHFISIHLEVMVQLLKLTKMLKNSFLARWMCHWSTWREVCAIMYVLIEAMIYAMMPSLTSIWFINRRLLKNLLIFLPYQGKWSHNLLLRKRLQGRNLLLLALFPVVLHQLLIHMKRCFHPFPNSLALANFSRFLFHASNNSVVPASTNAFNVLILFFFSSPLLL